MNILAIDIGGTKFSMAVFGGEKMVLRESRSTDRSSGREWMLGQVLAVAKDWPRKISIDRCGIGFGGPVDFERQLIACSTHVGGWGDFDLPLFIKENLGIPAVVDNDANAGALGEAIYGAGKGCDPLFYMTVSTGIGGGIVSGGKIFRGADGYAGEIGHVSIEPDGPVCLCGSRGCLERMCSGLWLEKDHGKSAKELLENPAFAEKYVENLARGIMIARMILNPARIVIGGGIAKAGDRLFAPLRKELSRLDTGWSKARYDVLPSALGDDNILYGAKALAERLK